MSVKATNAVWERSQHKGAELLLLLAIAELADDAGHANPSVPALANAIRMSERNTRYLLGKLVKSGELSVSQGQKTNEYALCLL